ncbi:MAG: hypothetical protein K6G65_10980 [Lachnospiraceae bacterium]|nr:hypothetical protein [Lachnospiraceae bacterium]
MLNVIPLIEICEGPLVHLAEKVVEDLVDTNSSLKKTIDECSKEDLYVM